MPSILERAFKFSCPIPPKRVDEVERWCVDTIGPRLYYLHQDRGGKQWRIVKDGPLYFLESNEDYHFMTWLALTN